MILTLTMNEMIPSTTYSYNEHRPAPNDQPTIPTHDTPSTTSAPHHLHLHSEHVQPRPLSRNHDIYTRIGVVLLSIGSVAIGSYVAYKAYEKYQSERKKGGGNSKSSSISSSSS